MSELAVEALDETQSSSALKDLFSGAVGGVAQVLIGQPFDIVKVRLQTTKQYKSALDAATSIYKTEGPSAFYKGTLTPLIGIGACVSVQFGAFHYARRHLEARKSASASHLSPASFSPPTLTYPEYFAAGAFAGLANTVFSAPIEHIRIRLQTQPHHLNERLYSGPLDCVRKLSSSAGFFRGVYRGTSVTLLREATAYGSWFLAFEYLMRADMSRNGVGRHELATWKVALYGGLAGEALWLASYPFDVVKSKMQSDGLGNQARYKTMRDAFGQTFKSQGIGGFWKGIGPTLLRAMPVSAGTFVTVEMTMKMLS